MKERLIVLLLIGLSLPVTANAATVTTAWSVEDSELAPVFVNRCINASIDEVWDSWTTASGIRSFFARDGMVDLNVDGEYSVLFFPEIPAGQRGAEGMRILAGVKVMNGRKLVNTFKVPGRQYWIG